jgi:hypothetical protein
MFDGHVLLTLTTVPVQGFQQRRVGPGELVCVAQQSETEMRDNQDDGWPKAAATYRCIVSKSSAIRRVTFAGIPSLKFFSSNVPTFSERLYFLRGHYIL